MLKIVYLFKKASLPANIKLDFDETENLIFSLVREFCKNYSKNVIARVAGGFVRDKLLGKPSKDIDFTIEGMTGIEFANALKQYAETKFGPNQKVIGTIKDTEARPEQIKNLAVAFLRIYEQDVEILSLRGNEVYEPGNRNPVSLNFNATPEQDAFRRDLTINSMFYNVSTDRIEDFTGMGYDDLATMTLRTPLDPVKTFEDDPLRLLRVLRFYSRYPKSKIAPEVIEGMRNPEVQNQITRKIINPNDPTGIVTERTSIELRKILQGNQPEKAFRIMFDTGLLQKMLNLPKTFHPLTMDQRNKHHQLTVIDHTLEVMKNVNQLSKQYGFTDEQRMMLNFCSLFHDLGKLDPRSHKIKEDGTYGYAGDPNNPNSLTHQQSSADVWNSFANALKLSDTEKTTVHDLVSNHMNPHAHIQEGASDKQLRKYIRNNPSWVFQYVHAMADAMSKNTNPEDSIQSEYNQSLDRVRSLAPTADNFGNMSPAQDLLNGKEIMDLVGLPAAPPKGMVGYIQIVKDRIKDAQDENPNLTKDQAIKIVQDIVASGELNSYRRQA